MKHDVIQCLPLSRPGPSWDRSAKEQARRGLSSGQGGALDCGPREGPGQGGSKLKSRECSSQLVNFNYKYIYIYVL